MRRSATPLVVLTVLLAACGQESTGIPEVVETPKPRTARTTVVSSQPPTAYFPTGLNNFSTTHEFVVTNDGDGTGIAVFTCVVRSGPSICVTVTPNLVVLEPGAWATVTVTHTVGDAAGISQVALESSLGGSGSYKVVVTPSF